MIALLAAGGLVMLAAGVAAYSGRWRSWARSGYGLGTMGGFAMLYYGIAFCLAAFAIVVFAPRSVGWYALFAVAGASMAVGLVGMWWLPKSMRPSWFRRAREHDARVRAYGKQGRRW